MQRVILKTKKAGALALGCSLVAAAQAQVIDALNGDSLSGYTTTLVLDNSSGAGRSVSFSDGSGSLVSSYVGTGTTAEQSLFLAPATSFASTFAVGDTLLIDTAVPVSTTQMDFGLAISAANPVAASAGNNYNSRTAFDWASINLRPSQTAIRTSVSVSGILTTGGGTIGISPTSVTGLYIQWVSADVFNLGYINTSSTEVLDQTVTFGPGSTIGTDIGFYGDLRATGTSLGSFSDLSIVPEPSTLALCGLGLAGVAGIVRRRG